MKKIIALILALLLCISALPTAFAANIGTTTEGLKKQKTPFHVGEDKVYYRQLLEELLGSALEEFSTPNNYCAEVWQQAQKLYTDEIERLGTLENIEDLVTEGLFGLSANPTTMDVYSKILELAELDKTVVKGPEDLQKLKDAFKKQTLADINEYHQRSAYNDYYWGLFTQIKDKALNEIESAETFIDFINVKLKWEYLFEDSVYDPDAESESIMDFFNSAVFRTEDLESLAASCALDFWLKLEKYEKAGHPEEEIYTEEVYALIDKFVEEAAKALYPEEIEELYESYAAALDELLGMDLYETMTPTTASFKKRQCKKVNQLFYEYTRGDYSEDNWETLEAVFDAAKETIQEAQYQEEIGDAFFKELQKQAAQVLTLAQELAQAKKEAIAALKAFVGSKKYNQSKVKPLVAEGTKKINAAASAESARSIGEKYVAALQKTVYTFKITVSKTGKGSVTKTAKVQYGKNFTVKITPAAGYKIKSIVVDGKKVKLTNAYTFKSVKKAHTIKVTFGK